MSTIGAFGRPGGPGPSHVGRDAGAVVAKSLSAGVSAASTVAALATAAGAATVPVAGWIAAAGITIGVGVIQLVSAIRQGNLRKAEAVKQARALGLPDAALVPAYAVRALEGSSAWREKQAQRLLKQQTRAKGMRARRLRAKLALLGAAAKVDQAASQMQVPAAPVTDIAPAELPESGSSAGIWIAAGALTVVGVGVVLYLRRSP